MEESHPCQLIAEFKVESEARQAAEAIRKACDLPPSQARVVPSKGVLRSPWRVSGIGFLVGLLVGLTEAALVILFGDERAVAQPRLTILFLGLLNALLGMAFASILTWRPKVLNHLTRALTPSRSNCCLLIVEMHNLAEQYAIREVFDNYRHVPHRITDSGYTVHDRHKLPA